jgi:LuxR family maltose regulon positive regulatory protein
MSTPILATKLYVPAPRHNVVLRPRLIERLNEGLHSKLTLIAAPAGFGKTTLVSEWAAASKRRPAWMSLDKVDNDPLQFLTYLIAALQTIASNVGEELLGVIQSPTPPSIETILTTLLNEISIIPDNFVLILDDYHVIDATLIDNALTFLIKHMPPQMHLVITTREDPDLPLARLRARGQLTELRVTDLRFTRSEAAEFLNRDMGLNLSVEDIATLETRTEGWIAGLQLAAISMQGHQDTAQFLESFTGSHRFVLDYLTEEVLQQQSESVQNFLLHTSILDRLCSPLCDAVLLDASISGQETLEYLERANLFIFPLDNDRRWYRYHHLFADLLRQRLHQSIALSSGDVESYVNELHIRASQWYEDNGFELEAFHHAAAGNDINRAERLIVDKGIPRHFRGAITIILNWLESLPTKMLNARPSLWWMYASLLLINGQTIGVEEKLQAADIALRDAEADDKTRYLLGRIAGARATLALTRYQAETMLVQSRQALEFLPPNSLSARANANWVMGYAHILQGDRAAARRAITEAVSLSQASGDIFITLLATIGLGTVQELENQLYLASETYERVLQLAGDQPLSVIYEAHLGLARVLYEWNDLEAAQEHGRQSLHLARQYDRVIDRFIVCEVFLARLKLAQGDVDGAAAMLAQASQSARQQNFGHRLTEIAAAQVLVFLRRGNLAAAAYLAQINNIPASLARVYSAQGDLSAALSVLELLRQQVETKGWQDERLKVLVLLAVAHHRHGDNDKAVQLLHDALAQAEPYGFIRLFVDEGLAMAQLLSEVAAQGIMPDYTGRLLAAFEAEGQKNIGNLYPPVGHVPIEPLSQRELEVLQLIAEGFSNHEICERLFLALNTVKGHNRKIYDKLQVQRRTEAVARARELGLL